jgi:hypothetical protein
VSRWLLQLKLKVAAAKSNRASKALGEAGQAAASLDTCLEPLEASGSAVYLALSQVGVAETALEVDSMQSFLLNKDSWMHLFLVAPIATNAGILCRSKESTRAV